KEHVRFQWYMNSRYWYTGLECLLAAVSVKITNMKLSPKHEIRASYNTASVYLSCLAIADTLYIIWVILIDLTLTFWLLQPFWHSHPWCGILGFLQYGSLYSSCWIVVMFTIERYLVLRSTRSKQHFSQTWVTKMTCTAIFFYRDKVYSTVIVWITTFLSGGVPIVLVIIFNFLIGFHLCRVSNLFTKEERRVIHGTCTRGLLKRTILLLGTVSAAFVFLSLPRFITYSILRTQHNNGNFNRNDYSLPINVAGDLANMLQNLNSTTNFLLYCMVSRRFRRELVQAVTCKAKPRYFLDNSCNHNNAITKSTNPTNNNTATDIK
uniref:G-protein coupled receptors family 1 profile domain-containing protein n=1 Tax=Cynoglossus semilaevis TaxID=244447 RepID=A0A3P8WJW7_CYNSE